VFVRAEWNSFFSGVDAQARSRGAAHLCAAVAAETGVQSAAIEDALRIIGAGTQDPDVLRKVQKLVDEFENRYEALVGDDEGRLSCQDPDVKRAFIQARAATAVMFALRGQFTEMAYEAVHAIDSEQKVLDYVRMLED
jgi:hypothetical protein